MTRPVYIVEEVGAVVTATAAALVSSGAYSLPIYYMYGHPQEIVKRLQELTQSVTYKNKKFPLIALFTDIPVRKKPGMTGEADLQIIIANLTQQTYTAEQRMAANFKPILYPIRDEFLRQFEQYRSFTFDGDLSYTSIDRFFWGKTGLYGNEGNVYSDFIDAIELKNLRVNIKNFSCLPSDDESAES